MHELGSTINYHIGGKSVLYCEQLDSTNEALLEMSDQQLLEAWTILMTSYQSKGRGQRASSWYSTAGKNLLCSILLKPLFLCPDEQFLLNIALSLAVYDTISAHLKDWSIQIKWPNDLYVDGKKIAGLLLQNTLQGASIHQSILGVGLNINEETFPETLPDAVSMYQLTQKKYAIHDVLASLIRFLEKYYETLENNKYDSLFQLYESRLLGIGKLRSFYDEGGREMKGIILGVDKSGRLKVHVEGRVKLYSNKELTFIF